MTETRDALDTFNRRLVELRSEDSLNPEGQALLNAIDNGSISPPQLGLILQGGSWNTSDEASGFLRSVMPSLMGPHDAAIHEQVQDQAFINAQKRGAQPPEISLRDVSTELERRPIRQFQEENPLSAMGYETLGALATGGPAGAGRSLAKKAMIGGGSGAVSGFGSGEGDFVDRLDDAAVGLVAGGLGTAAMNAASGPVANVYNAMFKSGKRDATRKGKRLAQQQLINAIQAEGLSVEEAIQKVLALEGRNYTLADLNFNTQALVDAVSVLPGPSKSESMRFLRERMAGRSGRITSFLQEAFGSKANFFTDFQAMKAARGTVANRLYGAANKLKVPVGDELRGLLQRPAMQEAYKKAIEIAANRGDTLGAKFILNGAGEIVDEAGNRVNKVPTLFLHYMKMGLDDVAFPKMPPQGIGAAQVQGIRDVRNEFLELLDFSNPMYARARNLYAGDSAVLTAMKEGRELLRTQDVDELADRLRRMNPSEKEAFRLGALQDYQDKIDMTPETANTAYNLISTPRRKQLLRLAFPNTQKGQKDFDIFHDHLLRESRMAMTERAGMNSATAQRGELIKQLRNDVALNTEIPTGAADLLFKGMRDKATTGQDNALLAVSNEISRILLETDPAKLRLISAQLGDGADIVQVIKANAPEFLPRILPFITESVGERGIRPLTVGNITGGLGADVYSRSPQLNDNQRAIAR